VRTHDTVPDPTGGGRLTRGGQRSPLCSLTLRGVDQRQDVLEPWRRRSAILRRDGRVPQQELGRLQGLCRGGISELQATARLRPALRRGGRGRRLAPGMLASGGPIPGQRWHGGLLRVSPRVRTAGGLPRRGPHRWLRKLCARRNAAARIPGRTAHGGGDRPRAVFPAGVLRGRPTRGGTSAMASDHHA